MKYWRLPDPFIRLLNMTYAVRGKCTRYLFQKSHGGQQVKLYEKEKYRNDNNTPLRVRARTIMQMAMADPEPDLQSKLQELYRTYPYYLLKDKKERLKITNFYFSRYIPDGTEMRIYRQTGPEPDPENDTVFKEFEYSRKKKILLQYTGDEEERYYARNMKTGGLSNVLPVYWN